MKEEKKQKVCYLHNSPNCENCFDGSIEETKTPQQKLDQAWAKFERLAERFYEGDPIGSKPHFLLSVKNAQSIFTSTLQAFIEAEIERLEGMKKKSYYGCITHRGLNGDNCNICVKAKIENEKQKGFNQAIDDQISHLKELKIDGYTYSGNIIRDIRIKLLDNR